MTSTRACVDCFPSPEERAAARMMGGAVSESGKMRARRPAPHPGPRCATHHRARKKVSKASTHERYVEKTYGLKPGEYARILELQGGTCALCRRARGVSKRLAVDHDHACCPETPTCGQCTRGLLCGPCNKILGHARDDPGFFARAYGYLTHWPAGEVIERRDG